ncbi:uncharacterized protein [Hoplias malabaricus]|uniref:uncharacterized protein isoform X2 n=1 Tax=Hoplias malabaricus TaxID=27720 RepID=UPI0034630730
MTLLSLRQQFEGAQSNFFFFSASGGRCVKILSYFQSEWTRMGFGGRFNFRHFRTTMVHYTKNLSPSKKRRIHKAMCHSEAVAEKFYVPLNNPEEAAIQQAAIEDCAPAPVATTVLPATAPVIVNISPATSDASRTEVTYPNSPPTVSSLRRSAKRRLDYVDSPSIIPKRANVHSIDSSSSDEEYTRRPIIIESDSSDSSENLLPLNKTGLIENTPIKAMLGTQSSQKMKEI